MIHAHQLRFSYNTVSSFTYPDITSSRDAPLLITGNSGTGKTTLLHLLGCLLQPTQGELFINGVNPLSLKGRALDQFRGRNIGIVYQSAHFMSKLSVLENMVLPQYFTGVAINFSKATLIAERLQLGHLLHKRPHQLSKGEQQRAAIARALMNQPGVILADEPTSSLDDDNTTRVIHLLQEQAAMSKAALIVVTHDARVKKHFPNQIHLAG